MYKRSDAHGYTGNALVKISAMGETEMHEIGFRCAQFRIDEIYIDDEELGEAIHERMGINVFLDKELSCKSANESSASSQSLQKAQQDALLQLLQSRLQQFQHPYPPLMPNPSPFPPDGPISLLGHTHSLPTS